MFIYYVRVLLHHSETVEVRGQLARVVFLFLCGFQGFTSGHEAWREVPVHAELLTGPEICSRILAEPLYLGRMPEEWHLSFEVAFCK